MVRARPCRMERRRRRQMKKTIIKTIAFPNGDPIKNHAAANSSVHNTLFFMKRQVTCYM